MTVYTLYHGQTAEPPMNETHLTDKTLSVLGANRSTASGEDVAQLSLVTQEQQPTTVLEGRLLAM